MFFYISKILYLIFEPYSIILISLAVASCFIKSKRRQWRIFLSGGLAILILLSLPLSGHLLISSLEKHYPPLSLQEIPEAEAAIVLLGILELSSANNKRIEFNSGVDRLLAAEELLRAGKVRSLLLIGGSSLIGEGGAREAEILREWLLRRGYEAGQIVAEAESRNTLENSRAAARLLQSHTWEQEEERGEKEDSREEKGDVRERRERRERPERPVLLITSAYHLHRSMLLFEGVQEDDFPMPGAGAESGQSQNNRLGQGRAEGIGFSFFPVPTDYRAFENIPWPESAFPSAKGLRLAVLALKEYMSLAAYYLLGYI